MRQHFIILLILLVTYSFVNAIPHRLDKRVTTFVPCASGAGSANPITVTLQPDPPPRGGSVIIIVSGTLNTGTIDTGSTINFQTFDTTGSGGPIYSVDLCTLQGATCPFQTGSAFSLTFAPVPVSANLPTTYTTVIWIMDAANTTVVACASGTITG